MTNVAYNESGPGGATNATRSLTESPDYQNPGDRPVTDSTQDLRPAATNRAPDTFDPWAYLGSVA